MSKKIILLSLMLLLPVMIWAQDCVEFDFSSSSPNDVVPATMVKDGIYLKFSVSKEGGALPVYKVNNKAKCLKLDADGVLTIEGDNRKITSIQFVASNRRDELKFYSNEVGKITKRTIRETFVSTWKGEAYILSFTPRASGGFHVKSIKVFYEKILPNDVLVTVSSAGRATLYYSDRSFKVPEGVVARTYKIVGNLLSQSKVYNAGTVLPKGTAAVLEAEGGKYLFEETMEKGVPDLDNALRGSDDISVTTGGEVYYMFAKGSNGVGFYWKEPDGKPFTTEAHKAYLVYSPSTVSQAKSFLGFDVSLGIYAAEKNNASGQNTPVYNLAGEQVGRDYKGIIIVNGKKYLNR